MRALGLTIISLIFTYNLSIKGFSQSIIKDQLYHTVEKGNSLTDKLDILPSLPDPLGLGKALPFRNKKDINIKELNYDFYPPKSAAKKYPLVIFMHGGSFIGGKKSDIEMTQLGNYLSKNGIAFASIDYRTQALSLLNMTEAGYLAIQDLHIAVKHFKSKGQEYQIGLDNVYIGGYSAGAIASLNMAIFDETDKSYQKFIEMEDKFGCLECKGPEGFDSSIKGVINISGGVMDLEAMNEDLNIIQFVGEEDRVIPPYEGMPYERAITDPNKKLSPWNKALSFMDPKLAKGIYSGIKGMFKIPKLYGALSIENYAQDKKHLKVETTAFPEVGHSVMIDKKAPTPAFYKIGEEITNWVFKDLYPPKPSIDTDKKIYKNKIHSVSSKLNHEYEITQYDWKLQGGDIVSNQGDKIQISFEEIGDAKLSLRVLNEYGLWSEMEVKEIAISKARFKDKWKNFWRKIFKKK